MEDRSKLKGKKQPKKSYEIYYDETSERFVFDVFDVDALFPLLIRVPSISPRELIVTKQQRIHLR